MRFYVNTPYEHGKVDEWAVNRPKSYIYGFILRFLNLEPKYKTYNLPFDDGLVDERVYENRDPNEEEIGWLLQIDAKYVSRNLDKHKEVVDMLTSDDFIYICEYKAVRKYYEELTTEQRSRQTELLDLL